MPPEPLTQTLIENSPAALPSLVRSEVRSEIQQPEHNYPNQTCDIAIVGGGVVGLTLACALKDSGLRILLIEAESQSQAVAREQAYSITLLSSQILAGIGVWAKILPEIEYYRRVHLSDAEHSTQYPTAPSKVVEFTCEELGTPVLGYVAEHRVLLSALQDALHNCPNIQHLCPAKVLCTDYQPHGVQLEVSLGGQTQQIQSQLVVAADGARSLLRQQAGISTHGWQYWQSCVVATIQPEYPHHHIAYEKFFADGPFAILPLPDNRCRIVWTAPRIQAEVIAALDDRQFITELTQRYGTHMGKLSVVGKRYIFPVQLMHSRRYIAPRLTLVGDAAHCCHPVGGQGINLGIRDAAALAEVLQTAYRQGQDIAAPAVLRRYERWRQRENLVILGMTDLLDRVFSNRIAPIVGLRRWGLWTLRHILPLRIRIFRLMTGLTGRMPNLTQGKLAWGSRAAVHDAQSQIRTEAMTNPRTLLLPKNSYSDRSENDS